MGRIVKVSVVDGKGTGVGGQTVVIGESTLSTTGAGTAQALLEEGDTVITVNGKKAYEGPIAELKPLEVFATDGRRL